MSRVWEAAIGGSRIFHLRKKCLSNGEIIRHTIEYMDIGAWGDSITYGAGDRDALGWVGRIQKELYDDDLSVYNRGICGDTTEDILKRFSIEVDSIEPDLTLLAVGINDSKFPNGGEDNKIAFPLFQENIERLIALAKSKSKTVIVIGLTEVDEASIDSSSVFKNEVIEKYDSYLQESATNQGLTFISMRGVLDTKLDLEDGLHPNSGGYQKMFEKILPFVKV